MFEYDTLVLAEDGVGDVTGDLGEGICAYDDLFEQWETVKDECGAATETEVFDLDELQTLVGVEVECDDHVVETVGAHGEVSTVDGEVHQLADGADGAEEFLLVAVVVGEGGDDLEHLAAHVAEGVVQVQFQVDAVGLHVVAPHGEDPVGVVVAPTVAEEDAGDGVACIGVADGLRGRGGVELEVVGVHRHLGEDGVLG